MGFVTFAMLVLPLLLVSGLVSGQQLFFRPQTITIEDGTNLTDNTEVGYFEDLCIDFQICKSGRQFAVLTIDELPAKQFKPSIPKTKAACDKLMQKVDKNDFSVAVPKDVKGKKIHTEILLLDELSKMAAWKKKNKNSVVDVYMFTFLSPCSDCTKALLKGIQRQKSPSIRLHFSWQDYYHEGLNSASNFFRSLNSLFSLKDKIILAWENTWVASKCGNMKRLSYQYIYYNCLIKKVTKVKNCNNLKSDWAKFVNKLTATCINDMDAYGTKLNDCISKFTNQFKNVNKQPVLECNPTEGKAPQLGPPLLPANAKFGSQSLVDLEGKYASGDFCFK